MFIMSATCSFKNNPVLFVFAFNIVLSEIHEIFLAEKAIKWDDLILKLSAFYAPDEGRPSVPIRRLVGLLILKYWFNLSDEAVIKNFTENTYYQYFCGETGYSALKIPCDPSTLSRFRTRIGPQGAELILAASVAIHGEKALEKEVIGDTIVQEKYTEFPTDIKLALDVIHAAWRFIEHMGFKIKSKHVRRVAKLRKNVNFDKSKNQKLNIEETLKELRSIASELLDNIDKKMPQEHKKNKIYIDMMENYRKAITQQRNDKNKIYSIFEPQVEAIAKGKKHKKFEFGSKVIQLIGKNHNVILGTISLDGRPHDSKTLEPVLEQVSRLYNGYIPEKVLADRGFRGAQLGGRDIELIIPEKGESSLPKNIRLARAKRHNRRSSIEQTISHEKNDHRLGRNHLRGVIGDKMNAILSAVGYNLNLFGVNLEKLLNSMKRKIKRRPPVTTKGVPFRRPLSGPLAEMMGLVA
jgi:IS5 family transposase